MLSLRRMILMRYRQEFASFIPNSVDIIVSYLPIASASLCPWHQRNRPEHNSPPVYPTVNIPQHFFVVSKTSTLVIDPTTTTRKTKSRGDTKMTPNSRTLTAALVALPSHAALPYLNGLRMTREAQ